MNLIKPYSKIDILQLTHKRSGEEKIGERVDCVQGDWITDIKNSNASYVLLGVPEDIGIRANYGRAGASTAFKPALESFLSQQHNQFLDASQIFVLGEIFVEDLMAVAQLLDVRQKSDMLQLRDLVKSIDERVTAVIKVLAENNKIPLVIGGGHNNAYGLIKGVSMAKGQKISAINCDAHLDFRSDEGRHSGNGFFCAYQEGFLKKYAVSGIHEQYNNQFSLNAFRSNPENLFYRTYESIFIREEITWQEALKQSISFVSIEVCGVEIDLDAITNVPTSAKTSSGISPVQARQFIYQCANRLNCAYLHIAEAAPVLSHLKADNKTGKLIAYLLSDFIKALSQKSSLK